MIPSDNNLTTGDHFTIIKRSYLVTPVIKYESFSKTIVKVISFVL